MVEIDVMISRFNSERDNVPKPGAVPWPELCRVLTTHRERATKEGAVAWSPTYYPPGARRGREGVVQVTCLVLDIDNGDGPAGYDLGPWAYCVHSTFSSTRGNPKWRVVYPLACSVWAEDWEAQWERMRARVCPASDPQCKDPSRLYFLPSCPPGDTDHFAFVHEGPRLDPKDFRDHEPAPTTPPPPPKKKRSAVAVAIDPGSRVSQKRLIDQAMTSIVGSPHDKHGHGRHAGTKWLLGQLRDNQYSEEEAEQILVSHWLPSLPEEDNQGKKAPFTEEEALALLSWVYEQDPRDPWPVPETAPPPSEEMAPPERKGPLPEIVAKEPLPEMEEPRPKGSILSAPELMALKIPERKYAIPHLLPEGLAIMAGKTKTGKSFAALGIAVGIASPEGRVFGHIPVETGDVLYLALEDNEESLQERLGSLLQGAPPPPRLHVAFDWQRINEGGLTWIEEWLIHHPEARLVIIDVLTKIRPRSKPGAGNGYEEDYELCEPLKKIADHFRVTILALHHLRKMTAEDPLDQVLGSIGMTGAPDTIWVFRRVRKAVRATLFVTGRRIRKEQERALEWDQETVSFRDLGDADERADTEERQEILDFIETNGPSKPKQVADALGKNPSTITNLMFKLTEDGMLTREGYGVYKREKKNFSLS